MESTARAKAIVPPPSPYPDLERIQIRRMPERFPLLCSKILVNARRLMFIPLPPQYQTLLLTDPDSIDNIISFLEESAAEYSKLDLRRRQEEEKNLRDSYDKIKRDLYRSSKKDAPVAVATGTQRKAAISRRELAVASSE